MARRRRRTKGHGFIKERKDGRRFAVLTHAGREYARAVSANATRAEAEEILEALRAEVRSGVVERRRAADAKAAAAPTFNDAVAQFLDMKVSKSDDKVNTRRTYATALNRAAPYLGAMQISKITRNDIEDVLTAINEVRTKATVGSTHRVLNLLFKWLLRRGTIDQSPMDTLDNFNLPAAGNATKEPKPMLADQVRALLQASAADPDPMFRLWVEVLAVTGIRAGEGLALTWQAIDWRGGCISIVASTKGKGFIGTTKHGKSRAVPIGPVLAGISEAKDERDAFYRSIGSTVEERDLIFPRDWYDGRKVPADRNTYASKFRRACRRAGLPGGFHPHSLRHGYTTTGLEAGVSVVDMAALLGHKDAKQILKTYGHPTGNRRIVGVAEAMISEPAAVAQIPGPKTAAGDNGTR